MEQDDEEEEEEPPERRQPTPARSRGSRRRSSRFRPIERKFPALRSVSAAYRLLAYLVAAAVVGLDMITFTRAANAKDLFPEIVVPLAVITLGGLGVMISLLAAAESILVLLDIEENTRAAGGG